VNVEAGRKLKALERVFALYDEVAGEWRTACRPACSRCCTDRVGVTTLEVDATLESLSAADTARLLQLVPAATAGRPPVVTTNTLAEICAAGGEPPDADEPDAGACPLLSDDLCPIYPLRPFNCRCFVSRTTCSTRGYAEVDEATVAANTLFLQVIEHIDAGGCSGWLPDVLRALADPGQRRAYREGRMACAGSGLTPNRPMRALMVPPEHRARLQPVIERLRRMRF